MNQVSADTRPEPALLDVPPHEMPGDPAVVLGQLAQLGEAVEREPRLLALRARCRGALGQLPAARDDVRKALVVTDDAALRRWLLVLDAHYRFGIDGGGESARARIMSILEAARLPAELPTIAHGYRVLAEIDAAGESADSLAKASRLMQLSTRLWERCGSAVNAYATRKRLASDILVPLGRFRDAIAEYDAIDDPQLITSELGWIHLMRGFARVFAGQFDAAEFDFDTSERMARDPLDPVRISTVAWGRTIAAARRGDLAGALKLARRAEAVASALNDRLTVPCLCDLSMEFGALGDLELAGGYLDRARQRSDAYGGLIEFTAFLFDARGGVLPADLATVFERAEPGLWARGLVVAALATARAGDVAAAAEYLQGAERELARLDVSDFRAIGERRTFVELSAILGKNAVDTAPARVADAGRLVLHVFGPRMTLLDGRGHEVAVAGRNQRALLGVLAANGGSISVDAAAEALWPDEPTGTGRRRLHNIHTRLRDATGRNFREGELFTLPGIDCDLVEFERLADLASAQLRTDPDRAAEFAFDAVAAGEGGVLAEFSDQWAEIARHRTARRHAALVDFLAIRAADAGDIELAERWQSSLAAAS